jgi:hypothetical protein
VGTCSGREHRRSGSFAKCGSCRRTTIPIMTEAKIHPGHDGATRTAALPSRTMTSAAIDEPPLSTASRRPNPLLGVAAGSPRTKNPVLDSSSKIVVKDDPNDTYKPFTPTQMATVVVSGKQNTAATDKVDANPSSYQPDFSGVLLNNALQNNALQNGQHCPRKISAKVWRGASSSVRN